jgi:hypothetical protein
MLPFEGMRSEGGFMLLRGVAERESPGNSCLSVLFCNVVIIAEGRELSLCKCMICRIESAGQVNGDAGKEMLLLKMRGEQLGLGDYGGNGFER